MLAARKMLVPRVAAVARRSFSTNKDGGTSRLVVHRQDGGIAAVQMTSGPVNALSHGMCEDLLAVLKDLEEDSSVRGLILGSSVPGIFSAGLHLPELLLPKDGSVEGIAAYWTAAQEFWLAFYTTQLATVAAMPGHCIGGGMLPALSCDARVMVEGKAQLGLNETTFGLVTPLWLNKLFIDTIGNKRIAEDMLMRGVLVGPEEAEKLGLVDAVVPLSRLSEEAHARMNLLLAVPDVSRGLLKKQLRAEAADALRQVQAEDLDTFITMVADPASQQRIATYLESLSSAGKQASNDD